MTTEQPDRGPISYCQEYRTMLAKEDTHPIARAIKRKPLSSPEAVAEFLRPMLAVEDVEVFGMLMVSSKNKLSGMAVLFRGTLDRTAVYPREVCKMAILSNAAAVILYHNHPSGDPAPSKADIALTESLATALRACGVSVHDHIIVGETEHYSFRKEGFL